MACIAMDEPELTRSHRNTFLWIVSVPTFCISIPVLRAEPILRSPVGAKEGREASRNPLGHRRVTFAVTLVGLTS